MSDYLVNNFTSGEVSPKLGGRYDLAYYHSGVKTLENFLPMLQGGITRRPGTALVGEISDSCRLIPFVLSIDTAFIIELSDKKLQIWERDVISGEFVVNSLVYQEPEGAVWTEGMLSEIQFTQDYEHLYLVHRSMPPKVLMYTGTTFVFGTMTFRCDPEGSYQDLFNNPGDYPGCIAYCANRLWFASSLNSPYRLWASNAFESDDFRTYEIVENISQVIKDSADWPSGWEDDPSSILEDEVTYREVTIATSAMVLEVGSNRNDRIEWLCAGRNIVVGTASSEWIIPGTINALAPSIVQTSVYGSSSLQGISVNEDILFIQSGGKRCRAYVFSGEGYSSPDLTFSADHILAAGVKEMHFQRVPEPRVYLVLKDGAIAVLSYNKLYQLQAWSRWTFEGTAESLCIIDTPEGQEVYAVIKRGESRYLEVFDEDTESCIDLHNTTDPVPFQSLMKSNRLDMNLSSGSSIGKKKKINSVVFRLLNSKGFKVGYRNLETHLEEITEGDCKVFIAGGYSKELRMEVQSIDDKPLTVLAMVLGLEVG